ncbi:MAG: SigE family RNA polymerase sigma factor [Actinoplanes sp.]
MTTVMKHPPAGTASGAEQDFRVFVQGVAASLHRTAYLLCGDWFLADDLVQETLAKAYSHWRKVQRADSPSAYVRRILINESRRSWRRNRNVVAHADAGAADLIAADMSDRVVDRAQLLQALQSLSRRQRATVVLRFLEGLSERETAAALGCSEGTVKSQTSRAVPQPQGDATLLLRNQVQADGSAIDVWDLHADNGDSYFAKTRGALPAQVRDGRKQADADGRRKVVAAAKDAAKGDLNTARKAMALAYVPANPKVQPTLLAPGEVPSIPAEVAKAKGGSAGNITDNWVWNNSIDALIAGAGSPVVRAGVLRLLDQMPEVAIKKGTVKGEPVYVLTAGKLIGTGDTLTINADTGLPIRLASGGGGTNYIVTRVTLAEVAKGEF